MKYIVIDLRTGNDVKETHPNCPYVVTPDGNVAWWDEGQGWLEDDHQEFYEVRVLGESLGDTPVLIDNVINDFPELGLIFKQLHERLKKCESVISIMQRTGAAPSPNEATTWLLRHKDEPQ